jgi:peptide deformylase
MYKIIKLVFLINCISVVYAQTKLEIITLGHPTLREIARELSKEEIQSKEMQNLIDNMIYTMSEAGGVGLAAPQVNWPLRLFVMKSWPQFKLTVVINPQLEYVEAEGIKKSSEGCLSIPGRTLTVPRYKKIILSYLNRNGDLITEEVTGFKAIVSQHEFDHLNGILIIDLVEEMMGEINWEKYFNSPRM